MARNDWGAVLTSKPRNNWDSVLTAPPRAAAPPVEVNYAPKPQPQRLSFASRFLNNLGDVTLDLTSKITGIGDDEAASRRLATDANRFQETIAKTAPGQTALRAEQGMADIAESGLSLASRGLGSGRMSARIHQDKAERELFLAEAEKGGQVEKWLGETGSRIYNSVIRSTTKFAAGGAATGGSAGIYSLIAGESFDTKLAEREAKGGGGIGDVSDAINAATIDAGLTFLFGQYGKRLGLDSLEESLSPAMRKAAEQLATKVIPRSLRQRASKALAGAGLEMSEENVIELTKQAVDLANGDRKSLDWTAAFEAGLTGGASRLAVGGVKETIQRLRKIPAQTIQETVEGVAAAEAAVKNVREPMAQAEATTKEAGLVGRGARGAKRFVENATPEMLAAARGPLSQKQFAEITGLKKTSAVFRNAFRDTLNLYAGAAVDVGPPQPAPSDASTDASPAAPATVEPATNGTPTAAPKSPTAGTGIIDRFRKLSTGQAAKVAKAWLQENFTSAGLRNQAIETANDERMGEVAAGLMEAEQLRSDFDAAVNKAYGSREKLTPQQVKELDNALKGKPSPKVPAEVMAAIAPMRAHVDSLSRRILDEGVVDPDSDLGLSIEANEGSYLTRTYRKHDDATWTQRVKEDAPLMDRARAWLKSEYPNDGADATEWRLNVLLDKDSAAAADAPASVPKNERDFMSVLKKRQDLSETVRALYGEYRDPWVNYTKSVAKMVNLLAHKQFVADVRSAGLATGFLSDEKSPRPENYRRIDAAKTPRLAEFADLYTDPVTAKALQDLFSPEFHSEIYRMAVKAAGYAKWAQTVGNSKTHVRNFVGNIQFAMSNGDLFSSGWKDAAKMTYDNLLSRGDENTRVYLRRLAKLGLVDSNIDVGDIRSMAAEMTDVDSAPREGVWDKLAGTVGDTAAGISRLYQAQDSFWKILAYENKKSQYAKAYPDASFDQVERLAADDVKAHYPTYSKLPKAIRWISRVPLIGPFISFPSEVVRTLKNSMVTIQRDLKSDNPAIQEMAKQRAVGLVSSFTLVPALAGISRWWHNVSDDEEDDLREFHPSWSQNSQIFHLGKDGNGLYDGVDLSFLDARSIISKPLMGLIREGNVGDRVERAAEELVTPLGEDLLFGRLLSVWRNMTPDGRRVFNPQAEPGEKAKQISQYIGQVLVPGTIAQLDRIRRGVAGEVSKGGKPYDAMLETAALFGLRISSTDVKQSFAFRNQDLERAMKDADAGILGVAMQRGTVTPGQITQAYESYNRQRRALIQKWHNTAMAAIRLGVPQGEVTRAIVEATGKDDAVSVLSGRFRPYLPSENALETMATRPNGAARVQQMISLYRTALDQQAAETEQAGQ